MLVSLEIKNFLLIKKISINFINGFNAFTGETGAGKSIIIELAKRLWSCDEINYASSYSHYRMVNPSYV